MLSKGHCGGIAHPESVPALTAAVHLNYPVYYWREGDTEKEQVVFLFWGKKAFSCLRMLPLKLEKWVSCGGSDYRIDEAWSRHRVPTFIEYRSQAAERQNGTVSLMALR